MALAAFLKQPAEVVVVPLTFALIAAPVSIEVVDVIQRGAGAALAVQQVPSPVGPALRLSGGGDACSYLVSVRAQSDAGEVEDGEVEVQVMDLAWSMPDGGAPMLSIAEFVARFGLAEVVRMTDGRGDGRIDRTLLVSALSDAQAVAEIHMAGRIALASPEAAPTIVKKIIADLTRAALYPGGAPDGVADQARASTKLLERIQAGTLSIGTIDLPGATGIGTIGSFSGGRSYPDGLADY